MLKAALSHHGARYGRTHDLARLTELIGQSRLPAPPEADRLVLLTPWATGLRYGEDPVEPEPLDRGAALGLIAAVRDWARNTLD